jgi:hypothetical protein
VKEISSHKFAKYWIDENGIYNFQYHPGVAIDLEAAQFISKERENFFNGKSYPILVDGRGVKFISKEAAQHFSSKENTKLFPAAAFLIDSFLSRVFGNYYLKVFPPNCPSRLYSDREKALRWLLKYK